jgi:putative ABC transport system permease protein
MNLLRLSWKNLTFKPLSMSLSIILFALGVGLVSLLFLLEDQLEKNFEKNLASIDLVVGAKGSPLQLILSSMYHVDAPTGNVSLGEVRPFLNPKHPLIKQAIPLSMGDNHRGYRIVGTTPDILDLYGATVAEGRTWGRDLEVTIGAEVAQKLGLRLGDTFSSSHGFLEDENLTHDHSAFRVVGILASSGTVLDQLLLTTLQTYWNVHEHEASPAADTSATPETAHDDHDHAHDGHDHDHAPDDQADAPLPDAAAMKAALLAEADERAITSVLLTFKGRNFQALNMQRGINENTDLQAATPAIEINRLYALMNTGEVALRILAVVIILVSALSIFISLFSSLRERQYELALMRVMGAGPGRLFALILTEGVLLAAMGCALGLLLSHAGMHLLGGAMQAAYRYPFSGWVLLPKELYLIPAALALGFLAAVWPAVQAARTDISETLLR